VERKDRGSDAPGPETGRLPGIRSGSVASYLAFASQSGSRNHDGMAAGIELSTGSADMVKVASIER
jgi:hypothetical protein